MGPGLITALLLLLLWLLIATAQREGFHTHNSTLRGTIFVAIASYRDSECLATVRDAFAKASDPGRIYVGICQQNKEAVESCVEGLDIDMSHVKLMNLTHLQARGPTYARYLASKMYDGQDYFLQIDSHTRFVDGWDSSLIDMLQRCPSQKPVLTHYPHAHDVSPEEMSDYIPVMCKAKWNSSDIPVFEAVLLPTKTAGLRRVAFCAGGMIFTHGSMLQEIPMDPNLDFLFFGEEILLSARMFTHGWDCFTPDRNVITHHYTRSESPRFWDDLKDFRHRQSKSIERTKRLLGLETPDVSTSDAYGMGSARSLRMFWSFSGLDPDNKDTADTC